MHARDSRARTGGGVIVVDRGFAHSSTDRKTYSILGRVCEFVEEWGGRDDFGRGVALPGSLGDLSGYMRWDPSTNEPRRPCASWRHVFPCITDQDVITPKSASAAWPGLPDAGGDVVDVDLDPSAGLGGAWYGNVYVVPNGPDDPPGHGFVGYYSPTYGGWVGNFPGSQGGVKGGIAANTRTPSGGGSTKSAKKVPDGSLVGPPGTEDHYFMRLGYQKNGYPSPPPPAPDGYHFFAQYDHPVLNTGGGISVSESYSVYEYVPNDAGEGGNTGGGGGHGGGTGDPTHPGSSGDGPLIGLRPVHGTSYEPDLTVKRKHLEIEDRIPWWPKFPIGHYGLSVPTMDVDGQIEGWFPTDPRIPCVNFAGGEACGALVCDLDPTSAYDHTRMARLHSALRVLKKPKTQLGVFSYGNSPGQGNNSLALQFGPSGMADAMGGYAFEFDKIAKWSWRDGGCMDVGALRDNHQIGADADGNPINGMHLATLACFTNGGVLDGPLNFEQPYYAGREDTTYYVRVHLGFNTKASYTWPRSGANKKMQGMWSWWTTEVIAVVTPNKPPPPTTPHEPQDPPPPPQPPGPVTPGTYRANQAVFGSGGSGGPSIVAEPRVIAVGASRDISAWRQNAVTLHEIAVPGILARPQLYLPGVADTRTQEGITPEATARVEATSPVVGRWAAVGAQGGRVGASYFSAPAGGTQAAGTPWAYTQKPGRSRFRGGSAPGGMWWMPPEVDPSDVEDAFAPNGLSVSTTYLGVAPGGYFASGNPDLATGGVYSGWSWGASGADLSFRVHSSSAVATEFLAFRAATNDINFNDGLAFNFGVASGVRIGKTSAQKLAFHGAAPIAQSTGWSSATGSRKTVATGDTLAQLVDTVGTMLAALIDKGLYGT